MCVREFLWNGIRIRFHVFRRFSFNDCLSGITGSRYYVRQKYFLAILGFFRRFGWFQFGLAFLSENFLGIVRYNCRVTRSVRIVCFGQDVILQRDITVIALQKRERGLGVL